MPIQTFLIVENNTLYRKILHHLIESQADWSVVAEAAGLEEVMLYLVQGTPDFILVDIDLPLMYGIEAIRCILQHDPAARIIAISDFPDEEFRLAGLNAGALQYVLKEELDTPRLVELVKQCLTEPRRPPYSDEHIRCQ